VDLTCAVARGCARSVQVIWAPPGLPTMNLDSGWRQANNVGELAATHSANVGAAFSGRACWLIRRGQSWLDWRNFAVGRAPFTNPSRGAWSGVSVGLAGSPERESHWRGCPGAVGRRGGACEGEDGRGRGWMFTI
jgi:hypothetical protein